MGALSATAAAATVVAAAAVDENDGKDDQPNPVVLKQIAQTVVHKKPPKSNAKRLALLNSIVCRRSGCVREICQCVTKKVSQIWMIN